MRVSDLQSLKGNEHHSPPAGRFSAVLRSKRKAIMALAGGVVVFLVLIIAILTGPAFPLIAESVILKAASKQGIKGSLAVSGNLWSGFSLNDVKLESETAPLRSLSVEEASFRCRISRMIFAPKDLNGIEQVAVNQVDLHLVIPEKPETVDAPRQGSTSNERKPAAFSPIWNLLSSDITANDVTARIEKKGRTFQIDDLDLNLQEGIEIGRLQISEKLQLSQLNIPISHREHTLTIGPASILENVELTMAKITERQPGTFETDATIRAAEAEILAHYSTKGEARVSLTDDQTLDLAKIDILDSRLGGLLSNLKLNFKGDVAKPESWEIFGIGQFDKLAWDNFTIEQAGFKIINDQANLSITRPDTNISLHAKLPLDRSDITTAPIEINGNIEITSLDSFLHTIAPQIPIDGSVNGKISNLLLVNGKTLQSGNAYLKTENTTWDTQPFDGVEIQSSVTRANRIDVKAQGALSGANAIDLKGHINAVTQAYQASGIAKVKSDQRLTELLAFLDANPTFSGSATAGWQGNGNLKRREHRGNLEINLPEAKLQKGMPFSADLVANYSETQATIPKLTIKNKQIMLNSSATWDGQSLHIPDLLITDQDGKKAKLAASIPLPVSSSEPVAIDLTTADLKLSSLAHFYTDKIPIDGGLTGTLVSKGNLEQLESKASFNLQPEREVGKLNLELTHNGSPTNPSTWDFDLAALITGLKWNQTPLENLSLKVDTIGDENHRMAFANLSIDQSTAKVEGRASIGLTNASDFTALSKEPVTIDGSINVAKVEQVLSDFTNGSIPLSGDLSIKLDDIHYQEGSFRQGTASLKSPTLAVDGTSLGLVDVDAKITSPDYLDAKLSFPMDGRSKIEGSGVYDLKAGGYAGKLTAIADLKAPGILKSILSKRNFADLLPANTHLEWQGKGSIPDNLHRGNFSTRGKGLTLANGAEPIDFDLSGKYTETFADIPNLKLSSRPLNLNGSIKWQDNRLSISDIEGTSSGKKVLILSADLPLDPKKLAAEQWFQQADDLSLSIDTSHLPVDDISKLFLAEPPINGTLNLDLKASGSPANPAIEGKVDLANIAVAREDESLPVGQLMVDLSVQNSQAILQGKFTHPEIEPFALNASIPFHPGDWASGTRNLSDESIVASAKMNQSSLAFLESQLPGVEQVKGSAAIDLAVSGTINEPKLLGNGKIDISRLRLENRNAPTFYDVDSVIRFSDNTLNVDRLHAIVSGGVVDVKGKAILDGQNPRLDFTINGEDVLVTRTPEVSVRTDVALNINGPWEQARLTGSLGITNSRYFKNVDLLPIGLLNRNKSVLPTVERAPRGGGPSRVDLDIGVPIEPFKNWPVTVHIATKDPFLIRGNLAQSEVDADLVILGTLGTPVPKGLVKIKEGELTLPFSKIDVEVGKVIFDEKTGFNGALEFKARAKAGDHKINIYAFNRILEPKHVLTSVPPIPPEDIMTLIATGSTRNGLVGSDGQVAASKAAMLVLKNIKKSTAEADREPSLVDKLQDRTELELGKVDPKTGAQTFGGKIRLWKQLFFVGDVGTQSDYRALVKYVFKYR